MAGGDAWPYDAIALDEAEKRFWKGLWETAVEDAVVDLGIDMVRFGPCACGVVTEEAGEPALNFILGAAAEGSVSDGYLPAALRWMDRQDVDYRVALSPGLPEFKQAEVWLRRNGHRLTRGPAKLVRDGSPPAFDPPAGIDIYERVDPDEDEAFGDPLAEALGFASWAATFFFDLPGTEDWRCFCAVDGDEPLAYAAMHLHGEVAVLTIASRLSQVRDGIGQAAVVHRCISEAVRAGCTTMAVAEAGADPAVGDRASLVRAGFRDVSRTFTWVPRTRVPM
jgi:hypothetical protein